MAPAAQAAESGSDPAAWLFDPTAVVEIDLDLPQATIDALELEPDEYQPGTFSLKAGAETHGPLSVGVRLKGGAGSFRRLSEKAALKVKFDEYVDDQTFFGLEKLTLNNMVQDSSMLHETFAYELFRAMGVAAPRTGYALVRVNDEGFGVYLNVETLDKISLPLWFGSTQHLYEGGYGTDVTPGEAGAFEVDEGKNSKREDLEALIVAANAEGGDWSDGVDAVTDLPQMTRMWAVERYIGHWDGYAGYAQRPEVMPNNFYLHSDQAGRFRMLPWGTDQTWEDRLEFDEPSDSILFNRCLADLSCRALYLEALGDLHTMVGALQLGRRATELATLLAPCQALETPARRSHPAAEIAAGVEETRDYIVAVRELLENGQTVYRGRHNRFIWPRPEARRRIPICVTAEGPRMLRLAGQIGDQVLIGTGLTPASFSCRSVFSRSSTWNPMWWMPRMSEVWPGPSFGASPVPYFRIAK